MGTTDTGGVITLTEADLDPYVTHAATRPLPTGPGLLCDSARLEFGALRGRPALRRVAELVADAGKLAAELRGQLVIGALRTLDRDLESLLLDGATGRISTTSVFPRNAAESTHRTPLTDGQTLPAGALAASGGRFTPQGYGPKAVADTSGRLMSVFAEAAGDDPAPYWRMAALIRPLARIARPGTGLRLGLPPRLLDEEFGSAAIVRFEDIDFPGALTHEPTRRFLGEVGLPEHGYWYELDTDVPLPTLAEHCAQEGGLPPGELPEGADRLIRLGHLLEDTSLVVDGATGAVLCWSEPDATLRPLNADVSTLAFTVWLVHREKALAGSTT
ncbi:SUKH-4 family immunity protein [Streptomyces sp. NPDC047079]|uniref:SUKH-4 family immunity protein n=1 Tax=Streptomyces sp. NPDC047079 TaxID=3154607 RepID=UPI00340E687D